VPTLAVLPVKRFDSAKLRLESLLAPGPRRALAEAMLSDVLVALRRAESVDAVLVVTADPVAERIAASHDADTLPDEREDGQSPAAEAGLAAAARGRADRALLVPGDCPLLDPAELDSLLGRPRAAGAHAIIVPDRHGSGTNALLLEPPGSLAPAFGEDSLARHLEGARAAGLAHEVAEVPSLALDVDTPDDLAALREALAGQRGGAANTRGMLVQFDRTTGAATAP